MSEFEPERVIVADLYAALDDLLAPRVSLRTHLLESAATREPWGGNYLRWDRYEEMRAYGWSQRRLRGLVMDPRTNVRLEDRDA